MAKNAIRSILATSAYLITMLHTGNAEPYNLPGNYMLDNGQKLLGNNAYAAISYSGHRKNARTVENTPSIQETKEDLKILSAMGIRLIRTYNTQIFPHSERILQSIRELKEKDPDFEMYVMLGAWIQCKNAYTDQPDHSVEDAAFNQEEISTAIRLASEYPDIVKIIAVGNEAMVTWQEHFVPAATILKWITVLQEARADSRIPADTLLTTSDNWAALGGEAQYRNDELARLMEQIDFISLHTYAFHDSYYNPALQWAPLAEEKKLGAIDQIDRSIQRSIDLQQDQYQAVKDYLATLGLEKEIHIGETGWASMDNAHYGDHGTCAANEYIAGKFYDAMQDWAKNDNLTCFYFEGFDEPWKSKGTTGSEGHFGLFTVDGKAKFALWDLVEEGRFKGLERGGNRIRKTHEGDTDILLKSLKAPAYKKH